MAIELARIERLEARLAIIDLNTNFCHFLDHGEIDKLVDLFAPEADYSHGQRISKGHDEIRQLFQRRSATTVRTARHLYSSLKVELLSPVMAKGQCVCMTFAADTPPPITPAEVYLVADFYDEYKRCKDNQWRISKRHIERIFLAPNNQGPIGQKTSP